MIRLVLMYVLFGMAVSLAGAAVSEGVFPSPGSNPLAGWQVNVPAGLEIKVESDGSLRVKDPVGSSGGSAGGIKTAPVWEGNPEEQPTYFSLTVAFQDVPVTLAHPALMVGFADEGGNGRGILLGFFRPSENEWLIGLVDNQAGLRVPVSLKKFADSTVHEYRVVKYRDPGDAVMKVQVLVDGKPAMKDPFPYSGLPSARGTKDGFRLTTLSPSRVTASVKHIQFGPFIGDAPLLAEDDSESERPERFSPVEATWTWTAAGADSSTKFAETNEGMAIPTPAMGALESDFVPLSGNRFYTLRAEVESGASAGRLRVKVRQYSRRSMEPESPDFASDWYVFKAGRPDVKVELPFYMQQASGRGRFILEIESGGTLRVKSVECGSPQSWPAVVRPVDSEDLVSEETAVNTIRERKASSAGLKAEKHHVAMLVDQNQVAPCIYDTMGSLHPDTSSPSMAARAGIHLQCRVLPSAVTGGGDAVWMGKDTYRMENVDAQIMRILRADPQAKIILMINVDPYPAWGSENPDEVCMNQKGQRAIGVEHFSIWGDKPGGGRFLPSLYSERVRQDAKAYLQAVVDHLENDPLGKAVIGYGVIGFNDYQFVNWAHWEAFKGDMDDYSPAAVRAFRNWLRSRYRDDVTLLQQAWKQPEITFESATIPQPQRRRGPELWLDPEKDQDVADFNRFYIEGPIEFISSLADSVKERTGGKKLVATYFASAMNGSTSGSGLGRMLNVPSVDLLFAPADYSIRLPGYPSGTQTAPDAVRLAGKLFIHEQDWPSYHTPIRFEAMDFAFGRAPTPEALSAMVKRDTGNMIARRQGTSFYELHVGAFSGREAVEIMSDAKKAMENCLDPIGKERVQVAFFIGERSLDYLKMPSGSSYRWSLLRLARRHWDTSGVPYHLYLQSDLTRADLPDYKVIILLSPEFMTGSEREALERLKGNGRTIVFLHAPGMLNGQDAEAEITAISGIEVKHCPEDAVYAGRWLQGDSPLLEGLSGTFGDKPVLGQFPADKISGRAFRIVDPKVIPLADFLGKDALACGAKNFGSWTSILMGVPQIDRRFLNNVAKFSDAWVVSSAGDSIQADGHFLVIHALAPGHKELTLPGMCEVRDPVSGKTLFPIANKISLDLKFGETRWFHLLPDERKMGTQMQTRGEDANLVKSARTGGK